MAKKEKEEKTEEKAKMEKKQIALIGFAIAIIGAVFLVIFSGKIEKDAVTLKIDCNGKDLSGTYKKGESFTCNLLDTDYKLSVDKITDEKVILKSDGGLTPVIEKSEMATSALGIEPVKLGDIKEMVGAETTTSTIDLSKEYKEFVVNKGATLNLTIQATDVMGSYYLSISFQ
jgi:hypothetical protein